MNVSALVVQYLMKNRAVSEKNLKDFVHQVNPNESQLNMKQILEGIRLKLCVFNLTVELIRCELTGVKFFVCLSTVERECLAEFPVLSKEEEDCMFALVDEIMNNNGSPIISNDAINIIMGLEQPEMIRPDKAINILTSFVSKNILVEKQVGYYLLGPLVLSSLRFYLSSNVNAKVCALCTKDVVYSKSCHLCDAHMHYYCFKEAQENNDTSRCPICQR